MGDDEAAMPRAANGTDTEASVGRVGLAMLATAVVLWLTLQLASYGLVAAAFGGLAMGAVFIIGGGLASIGALLWVLRPVLARRAVAAAISLTLVAGVVLGITIGVAGRLPVMWVEPGLDLVYPAIAIATAPMVGVFTRRRLLQVLGALTLVCGLVAAVSVLAPEPPLNDLTQPRPTELLMLEFAELNRDALVVDLPGYEVASVGGIEAPGDYAWVTTPGGGLIEISVTPTYGADDFLASDIHQCWALAEPDMGLADEDSIEDYASWCVPDGDGWARVDGTAVGFWEGMRFVVVKSADEFYVTNLGAARRANPDEVAEAAAHLRPVTSDEFRQAFEDLIPEGER